ncbi:MAG: hypothetical protein K2Q18_16700, partial [Bdellovibrionales bacterium]|nr:hypothetical protein [Bdellovibrionales bacterium]
MDVRDQSYKVDQAREQFKDAQKDLKSSYDKNVQQMKETFDSRIEKQANNYDKHKSKLEEDNKINNELYTDKTKTAIHKSQEEFKNKLRENTGRFEKERNDSKQEFNEKLTDLSSSFKKSLDENDRYQDQIKKSMTERYAGANKRYQEDFNDQINNMDSKFKSENIANRDADRKERMGLLKKSSEELEGIKANANDEKFKEVSRLRSDSENLRTTLSRENQLLKDRQEERVAELLKLKGRESDDGMKKFANLQDNIRQKNVDDQERQAVTHNKESKDLEHKFNEDIRNIQKIAAQKVRGGTSTDSLKDELIKTKMSYENRLSSARDEIAKNNKYNTEKEEIIDNGYRTKLREAKAMSVEKIAKNEVESNEILNKANNQNREKNTAIVEQYEIES